MNIIYFIRLLLRNAVILILLPIVLFTIVFFLTQNQPKVYNSSTTIYTGIATGSSIVSLEESKYDLFGTYAAFDNLINIIKSRSTAEEVGLRLFTSHIILEKPDPEIISAQSYNRLMEIVPDEVKAIVVKGDFNKTYQNLVKYKNKDYKNFVYELIQLNHAHYSASKIMGKLKVTRIQSSDLIQLSYSSDDPGVCYNTLNIVNDVFVRSYSEIKVNQSDAVVKYFVAQLDNSSQKLSDAENELLEFNRSNSIINYYEQTKSVASEKESFELEFQKIKMDHGAAESVIQILEQKLSTKQKTQINTKEILETRNQLAEINLEIAMKTYQVQLDSVEEQKLIKEISELKIRAYELQEQLKESVNKQYFIDNSVEGVTSTKIIDDWIEQVILFESTKAQILIGEQRQKEFIELFRKYAPLGATMKRLERKIDVVEREYLSLLHSLSLAKLKQQNVELNSNLKISEPPYFPIEAQPSKRKFLLLIALMIGFIIPAFLIIAIDFLDQNIKTAKRAAKFTGLKVAAVYPNTQIKKKLVDLNFIESRAVEIIIQKLQLFSHNTNDNGTQLNLILSSFNGEGKTTVAKSLLNKLQSFGFKSLLLTYDELEGQYNFEHRKYEMNNYFQKVKDVRDLKVNLEGLDLESFDYIFVELPGLVHHPFPFNLLNNAGQLFLVTRANRPWGIAETYAIKDILNVSPKNKLQIILNGVDLLEMETVLGDLPKKRSFIRRFVKNILRFHFYSKKNITKTDKSEKKSKRFTFLFFFLIPFVAIFFALVVSFNKPGNKIAGKKTEETEKILPVKNESQPLNEPATTVVENTTQIDTILKTQIKREIKNNPEYYLIGGSFGSHSNAENYFTWLTEKGYSPLILDRKSGMKTIAIGVFSNEGEALLAQKDFLLKYPKSEAWILADSTKIKVQ